MKKIVAAVLILIFAFSGAAFGRINKKAVSRAWKNIARAENFPVLEINFEDDDEPNAWVAYEDEENYSVHVTTGLMEILESESEIAGVLGHELGHIKLGHYYNFELSDTVRAIMGANLERTDDLAQAVGNIDMELKESKFSREQETEADNYGVKILVKAGYSSWGLYDAMKKFEDNDYGTESNGFNSHPASEERLKNLAAQARKNNYDRKNNHEKEIDSLADILMGR